MTDVGVGDAERPYLDVTPADVTTVATLTVTAPDGTVTGTPAAGGALVLVEGSDPAEYTQRWATDGLVVYTAPGRWVLSWEVAGTGEGAETLEVYVVASPVAGGPTWLPGRSQVAKYVPHRTLERSVTSTVESADAYALTFTSNTLPTGIQADALIADGAAWVGARLSPLAESLQAAAAVAVCLYCAAAVERGWPEDDNALQRANDLEKRLDVMLADLIAANNASNGTDDFGVDIAPLPIYSFPAADPRYDYPIYW